MSPDGAGPGLFEPVHGSAPDIAGSGVANPVGAVWAGALMLEHLGEAAAAARVIGAVEAVLGAGAVRTPDLGGSATTSEVGQELETRDPRGPAIRRQVTEGCVTGPGIILISR